MLSNITNTYRRVKTDETKYKTEMCRNWMEHGSCEYGPKCNYAHGKRDLFDKIQPNENYKTKT
jgi:butyrate response factor 1